MKPMNRKQFLKRVSAAGATAMVAPSLIASSDSMKEFQPTGKKIKVGVIGCGSVSAYYLKHLSGNPYAEIVSLCDIIPERAENRAKEYKVKNWYPNIDEMLSGVDFELFVNLTDMQEHYRLNKIALNAGKHVWSEKPMSGTYEEGAELLALASRKGVHILGAPVVVNSPQFAFLSRQIHEGHFGRISAAHGNYGHLGPSWSAFFYQKMGGSIPDLAVYNITSLTGLLGPAVSVMAMTNIISPTREIDNIGTIPVTEEDNSHILIEHESGAISHVQSGFNYTMAHSYESENISTISIIGTKARMDMIGYDWDPIAVDIATPQEYKMQRKATEQGTYVWEEGASVFCEYLATGKKPLFTAAHALHAVEIMEAARKSGETGQRIDIRSKFRYPVVT